MLMNYFSCKEELPHFIEINNITIEREDKMKLSGITIDDKLTFDKYIDICVKMVSYK